MKILGLDPGLATTGFGLLEVENACSTKPKVLEYGVIQTTKDLSLGDRLKVIYSDMQEILQQWQPSIVGMEKLFFYRMGNLIAVAQARGVILLALAQHNITPIEFSPPQVKQSLTGYGRATKAEVQEAILQELNLKQRPQPDDAADALAIALTCWVGWVANQSLVTKV